MSGTAVIKYLLANNAAVIAVVPASRIVIGNLPVNITIPAISVKMISGTKLLGVRVNEAGGLRTHRTQVTVHAASGAQQQQLMALALAACPSQRGTVAGVSVDSIIPDGEGPDLSDPDAGIYEQSQDLMVRWVGP